MRDAFKITAGSCAVYAMMAACSGGGSAPGAGAGTAGASTVAGMDSTGGEQGAGGTMAMSGAPSMTAGIAGMTTSPVPDAGAQPMPGMPTVADEPCNKVATATGDVSALPYAEHGYLGKTAGELASVRALRRVPFFAGYEWAATNLMVRDGYVASTCGSGDDVVRFVAPF